MRALTVGMHPARQRELPQGRSRKPAAVRSGDVDVVLCGHTHIAEIIPVADIKIVNAGTVGQPEDGDYRAQCMVIENGDIRFDRVEYDFKELEEAYAASSMPEEHRRYYLESTRRGYGIHRGLRKGPFSAETSG